MCENILVLFFVSKVSVPIMGHLRMIEYYCTQITHRDLNFGPKTHQLVLLTSVKKLAI